jgi:uncharacterized protein (TIGR02757 family)
MVKTMNLKHAHLHSVKLKLEEVQNNFFLTEQIENDPLSSVLQYKNPQDQEIAAFIAAVFSYGNVKQIQKSLSIVFSLLGKNPSEKIRDNNGAFWKKNIPKSFKHRFNNADDLGCLLTWLGEVLRQQPTLEAFFLAAQKDHDFHQAEDISVALEKFILAITSLPSLPYRPKKSRGVLFFFPKPSGKSACKRLMLYLRWVVGSGPMDLNLWKSVPKNQILIPLDTHVLRISRHLGLTTRKDNSWRTAFEITQVLKKLDPEDPTRFDFALCHLGISKECPSRLHRKICDLCRMNELCVTYAKGTKTLKS